MSAKSELHSATEVEDFCCVFIAEEGAYKVLTNGKSGADEVLGIPIITSAYEAHKDNAEVVENICTLIMELCEYGKLAVLRCA